MGANYREYRKNIETRKKELKLSYTVDYVHSIARSGLSDNGLKAYQKCLETEVMAAEGLHAAILSETAKESVILVRWYNKANLKPIKVTWSPDRVDGQVIKRDIAVGSNFVKVPRPQSESVTLVMSHPDSDDRKIELLPPPPPAPEYKGPTYVFRARFVCAASNKDGCADDWSGCISPAQSGNEFDPGSSHIEQLSSNPRDAQFYSLTDPSQDSAKREACFKGHSATNDRGGNTRVNAKLTIYEIVPAGNPRPPILFSESYKYPDEKPFPDLSPAKEVSSK